MKEIKDESVEVEGRVPWTERPPDPRLPVLPRASEVPRGTARRPWSSVWKPPNPEQPSSFSVVGTETEAVKGLWQKSHGQKDWHREKTPGVFSQHPALVALTSLCHCPVPRSSAPPWSMGPQHEHCLGAWKCSLRLHRTKLGSLGAGTQASAFQQALRVILKHRDTYTPPLQCPLFWSSLSDFQAPKEKTFTLFAMKMVLWRKRSRRGRKREKHYPWALIPHLWTGFSHFFSISASLFEGNIMKRTHTFRWSSFLLLQLLSGQTGKSGFFWS